MIIKQKKIFILYINGHGEKFSDFPSGVDKSFKNVTFIEPNLEKNSFFTLDDHLNANGHKIIGLQLSNLINN
jgi:hypothetical protein